MYSVVEERNRRTQWFRQARFGLFIHFGLYAIPARGEWVMSNERLSKRDYQSYFQEFNPVHYNPRAWAKAAKAAGMKYAVLTAKHHDGFCLFDSAYTDYKATKTPAGRDLVAEFLSAFREEGLRVGLYYSLLDWHHPDYPHFGDRHHPMRDNPEYQGLTHDFTRYLDYLHGQVRELCTNYGQLDILWFDFSYDQMVGDKWRASELVSMVRSLQPQVIIDNRLEASGESAGSIRTANPNPYAGDFASPEQIVPPQGIVDQSGHAVPWEACITMNNSWGYAAADQSYKPASLIVRKLVECVSKNGNMILNVGPSAKGEFPPQASQLLREIGEWIRLNGDSIYGCGKAELPKPEWGYYTQREDKLYAHVLQGSIGPLALPGLRGRVQRARLLRDGSELRLISPWNTFEFSDCLFLNFGSPEHLTYPLPDQLDTVVELSLKSC
ncbi:MAG: alpha-L-fucosidase [Bacillota bacterium]